MPSVFARDHSLDVTLESEARLISILVGIGIGILLLVSAIIIHGSQLLRKIRRGSYVPGQIANQAEAEKGDHIKAFPPNDTTTSMPRLDLSQHRREPLAARGQRVPAPFIPIRKSSSAPHRPAGVYNDVSRSPFTPTRSSPADRAPHKARQQTKNTPAVPQGIVTAHIAEWNRVADSVVGRHPNAQPLSTRVATQAEIDLISGHVHIPWAFTGKCKSQPMPVKVLKPIIVPTPSPIRTGFSKDIGAIPGGRDVLVTVNNTMKRPHGGKNARRVHRKENMPPAPARLARSDGRF
ncbi:hypothetical protein GALMADRAFT_212963 [Galerina marginata CBS 339.88]|uniref:Uncharacterized protein n=1 Tax=Galerina marginata (strain CBS 339.88) TaxID=685588 RepID=A0A067SQ49_GALM3|nr:hypothetical protein GALMADRAFT_212963 [Galerina marginata CBS 339.88]